MSENKSKYANEAAQIEKAIRFGDFTDEWLKNNGLSKEYLTLLYDMRRAKTRFAFNKAKLEFKKKIVRPFYEQVFVPRGEEARIAFIERNPIMDFMSPKGLGSYDDIKKNEKVKNSKYATVSINDKGEEVVNVPLLRMIDDPGELSEMAHYLDVDADELRDHILNEWDKKKKKEWSAEEKAMRNAMINGGKVGGVNYEGRKGVLKEFDNNSWSAILKSVSPNIYARMRRDIAEGKGPEGNAEPSIKVPILKNMFIPKGYGNELLMDTGRNAGFAGSLALGPAAAVKMAPNIAPVLGPALAGVGVGANEWFGLKISPYYNNSEENNEAAIQAGKDAATIPSIVGGVLGLGSKVGSKALNHALRTARKVIYRGEKLPSVEEQERIYDAINEAAARVGQELRKGDVVPKVVGEAVNKVAKMLEDSPYSRSIAKAIKEYGSLDDYVRAKVLSKNGLNELKTLLTAPSKKTFFEWNKLGVVSEIPEERVAYQHAVENVEKLFPNTYKEINAIPDDLNKLDVGVTALAKGLNSFGGVYEPIKERPKMKEGFSAYENSHPEQVEQWKRYGIPEWDPLAAEFKEKYGQPETVMSK